MRELSIKITKKDAGVVVIELTGALDSDTHADCERKIAPILEESPHAIVFNMENLDYISSIGFALIYKTKQAIEQQYRSDPIRFRSVPGAVMAWWDQGLRKDPRPKNFRKSLDYRLADLVGFASRFTEKPLTFFVLGNKDRVDLEALRKILWQTSVLPWATWSGRLISIISTSSTVSRISFC